MKNENHEVLLEQKGLKKTKVRMALLQHFMGLDHAQSYSDLQTALAKEVDKSTLYRNLTSFEQAGIIHRINDHSGVSKYAFGESPIQGNEHAHFVCECCETVYCMEGLAPLQLKVPKGFKTKKVQTIIRGICAAC
ncbi:Fur family transcriptional regulator [Flagellimonas flava]|uniref:Fur family transcriptional regulator, ferric uptake regulator n=1 Tax=Flagellimonas flava TaxID=570519 RepID=A0A1M5LV75_9FLAO|nr:transcriptional repressor [Allomuricauda flava]SHG68921.1 Fur family transcriptional regulator, ferric uptake regulator [Allomuricauda flava]